MHLTWWYIGRTLVEKLSLFFGEVLLFRIDDHRWREASGMGEEHCSDDLDVVDRRSLSEKILSLILRNQAKSFRDIG